MKPFRFVDFAQFFVVKSDIITNKELISVFGKIAAAIAVATTGMIVRDNVRLTVTRYTEKFEKLPESFNGFTIVHASDLHNQQFGENQSKLIEAVKSAKPDMIAVTGDLFHTEHRGRAYRFIERAAKIAPCYYVSGNHEQRFADYFRNIKPRLQALGAVVLDDERVTLSRNGENITVIGLADPSFKRTVPPEHLTEDKLSKLTSDLDGFTILLSHRPELLRVYARHNISLALAGHAHGGQIRFRKRGLFAVHQGWFPKYTEGIVVKKNTKMLISRGLGNSTYYPKINNPPELAVIKMYKL